MPTVQGRTLPRRLRRLGRVSTPLAAPPTSPMPYRLRTGRSWPQCARCRLCATSWGRRRTSWAARQLSTVRLESRSTLPSSGQEMSFWAALQRRRSKEWTVSHPPITEWVEWTFSPSTTTDFATHWMEYWDTPPTIPGLRAVGADTISPETSTTRFGSCTRPGG